MLSILSKWLKKKNLNLAEKTNKVKQGQLPHHVAIIMDGNGRWARAHGLPRVAGHRAGMKTVREITQMANDIGIKILTMYAFSTENWKRPVDEVNYLMSLPDEFLLTELEDLIKNNVQVKMIGDENGLPHHTRSAMLKAVDRTKNNTGLILNFALNYGSRIEITKAISSIASDVQQGKYDITNINEELVDSKLLTVGLADPDLLIRTSGELRLSNFMLWQLAYTEFWFTNEYWPGFTKEHFLDAVIEYQNRKRRYGAV